MISKLESEFRVCLFGAINGLLVGVAFEFVRLVYIRYQTHQLLAQAEASGSRSIGYVLEPTINGFLPILCIVTFSAAAHLTYRYFVKKPAWLLTFWVGLGCIGIISWYFEIVIHSVLSFTMIAVFLGGGLVLYRTFKRNPNTPLSFWTATGFTAVGMVFATVQTIGLFMVQRYELREPSLWILCLTIVLMMNSIFGAVIKTFVQPSR